MKLIKLYDAITALRDGFSVCKHNSYGDLFKTIYSLHDGLILTNGVPYVHSIEMELLLGRMYDHRFGCSSSWFEDWYIVPSDHMVSVKKNTVSLKSKDTSILSELIEYIKVRYGVELDTCDYCGGGGDCYAGDGEMWTDLLGDNCWTCCVYSRSPLYILRRALSYLNEDDRGDLDASIDSFNQSVSPYNELEKAVYYTTVARTPVNNPIGFASQNVHVEKHNDCFILVQYGYAYGGSPELTYQTKSSDYVSDINEAMLFSDAESAMLAFSGTLYSFDPVRYAGYRNLMHTMS